ncbi:hypothetical protein NL676_008235 [Syzygium grande]|nr:hypothetical protein NL676_008235 [Syzygium grande]
MEWNQETLQFLSQCFLHTLSPSPAPRRQPESSLADAANRPSYALAVLRLVAEPSVDEQIRQAAAVNFKNHLRARWASLPTPHDAETALKKTEGAFLEIADRMVGENPELALMGSCVLVMLMRGEDIYLMNVGDSRAILAQKGKSGAKGTACRIDSSDSGDQFDEMHNLISLQLTQDHSTYVEEEVHRIRNEHPDDASAVVNDRVKGYLKVTRAFGAGFLKQLCFHYRPKWNNALLEMFRIDYIGTSPYITCTPSQSHHRLRPRDRFLILSSDGLNQCFTNQEAISEVDSFLSSFPEGDPRNTWSRKCCSEPPSKPVRNPTQSRLISD